MRKERVTKFFTVNTEIGADGVKRLRSLAIKEMPENNCLDLNSFEETQDIQEMDDKFWLNYTEGLRIGKLVLPKGMTKIKDDAFNGKWISEVVWPDACTHIPARAFMHSAIKHIYNIQNVRTIGEEAFRGSSIKEICIPDGVTEIPKRCFLTSNLQEISGCANVKELGVSAFDKCAYLKSFVIPKGVKEISEKCFYKCIELTCVSGFDDITSFGADSFASCTALRNFPTFEKTVCIGPRAFRGTRIEKLDLSRSVCSHVGAEAFADTRLSEFTPGYFLEDICPTMFLRTPYWSIMQLTYST